MQNLKKVQMCVDRIFSQLPQGFIPAVGVVLGTGLGGVAEALESALAVQYASLTGFPQSKVASHAGRFLFGTVQGVPVVLQQGRCHLYEGYSPAEVCMGVRVMAGLGIHTLVITNAAGAINPQFATGNIMLIEDHINMTGKSPLAGDNETAWGPRFPDMSAPYDAALATHLENTAMGLGMRLEKGVYVGIQGPQLETRAETRMLRGFGADAVGMSTVLEVIAARHMGLRVAGLSCLTNKNLPDCMEKAELDDIIQVANQVGERLGALLTAALPTMAVRPE